MSGEEHDHPQTPWSREHALGLIAGLEDEIGKVIVGQTVLIRRLLTGLFAAIPFATADSGARVGCQTEADGPA